MSGGGGRDIRCVSRVVDKMDWGGSRMRCYILHVRGKGQDVSIRRQPPEHFHRFVSRSRHVHAGDSIINTKA